MNDKKTAPEGKFAWKNSLEYPKEVGCLHKIFQSLQDNKGCSKTAKHLGQINKIYNF